MFEKTFACYACQNIEITVFQKKDNTYGYICVSFSMVAIISSNG